MSDQPPRRGGPSAGDNRRVFIPAPSSDRRPAPDPGRVAVPPPPAPAPPGPQPPRPGGPGRPPRPPDDRRPSQPTKRRVRWRRVLVVVAVLVVLGLLGGFLWLRSVWGRIDRVEVSHVLSGGGDGTNYLIVGSDARPEGEEGPAGQRSDTIMLLHLEGGEALIMSIPRDLYVEIPSRGGSSKINAAYNDGPAALIETITQSLGIPVDRYMEVDFVSFGGVVDGIGGVTVDFPHPAYDERSGLFVPEAGPVQLDGEQALAYVRSRRYTEVIDGTERTDGRGDLGRIQRQQDFLTAVAGKLGDTRNPLALARAGSGAADGLRIDDAMSMVDGLRFVWALRGIDPQPLKLPVDSGNNESGSVLFLRQDEAGPVLDRVR